MYKIRGKYIGCPREDIDEFDTREEALLMLSQYRIDYGPYWMFSLRKVGVKK